MTIVWNNLRQEDSEVYAIIKQELARQEHGLELIASENFVSKGVMEAMGSILTNKYAEGYPKKRYYGGCVYVDMAETLARERVKELFHAKYANVQPHSGSQANMAAYFAVADPGSVLMGMALSHGGHLTHGAPVSFSGKIYRVVQYGVNIETEKIDYDEVEKMALEHNPKILVAGGSAYSRIIDFKRFRQIADRVGAYLVVDMAHFAGLVAGKVFTGDEDPVPHAHVVTTTTHKSLRGPRGGLVLATEEYSDAVDKGCPMVLGGPLSHVMAAKAVALAEARQPAFREYAQAVADNAQALAEGFTKRGARLVTGGTDNHLVLLDVTSFGLTGRQAESALLDAGVVTNRNAIPADPNGAWYTSGIRFGTPALTTRGFGAAEFDKVAELVVDVLSNTAAEGSSKAKYTTADGVADRVHAASAEILAANPLYPGLTL